MALVPFVRLGLSIFLVVAAAGWSSGSNGGSKGAAEPINGLPPSNETSECQLINQQCGVDDCHARVLIQYDLDTNGRPFNIEALDSCPPNRFHKEAVDAVATWKWDPPARVMTNQKISLQFPPNQIEVD